MIKLVIFFHRQNTARATDLLLEGVANYIVIVLNFSTQIFKNFLKFSNFSIKTVRGRSSYNVKITLIKYCIYGKNMIKMQNFIVIVKV